MTAKISFEDMRQDNAERFTRVAFKLPYHISTREYREWAHTVIAWLEDPERPGQYSFDYDRPGGLGSNRGCLLFSDPDVAFEFKMRWA